MLAHVALVWLCNGLIVCLVSELVCSLLPIPSQLFSGMVSSVECRMVALKSENKHVRYPAFGCLFTNSSDSEGRVEITDEDF